MVIWMLVLALAALFSIKVHLLLAHDPVAPATVCPAIVALVVRAPSGVVM